MKLKTKIKATKDPIFRLCVIVMGVCIALLGVIFAVTYSRTSYKALNDSVEFAELNVSEAKEIVARHLAMIEVTAQNLSSTRIRTYRSEAQIYDLLERFVEAAPEVWGIAIGYEPGVLPDKGDGFAPYVCHCGDTYERLDLLSEGRDYLNADWYRTAIDKNLPTWSKPFRDVKGALITCYCMPLVDEDGDVIGVIAVDLQLDKFTDELVNEVHPYEHSQCMVLDEDLDFIAHPDHKRILTSFVDYAEEMARVKSYKKNDDIIARIKNREAGHDTYADNTKHYGMMFYSPVNKTNWTVALSIPMRDIFKDSFKLVRNMFILCVLGILILVAACWFVFKKIRTVVEAKIGIEKELSMAHSIQMAMIKKLFPPYPERDDIDIYATLIPAKEVGGDLYDFAIHGDEFHFCIGDVSGKGVPASLFMATTLTLYRGIISHENSPARIATLLNDSISADNEANMFVTMYIGVLNLQTGLLTLCNCGHNPPLLSTTGGGRMSYLSTPPTNLPIGVIEDFEYREVKIEAADGLGIFLYTDGVTEAEDSFHNLYGEARLESEINSNDAGSGKAEIDNILKSVNSHTKGFTRSDDITMLSVRYNRKKSLLS